MAEPKLNTDEIENLLREAQAAAGISEPGSSTDVSPAAVQGPAVPAAGEDQVRRV